MIITKDFPGKEFANKEDLFAELRANAIKIIAVKKAEIQKSHLKGFDFTGFLTKDLGECKTGPQMKDGYIYPILNTTKYMDSHRDVHFDGIWTKSVKEQAGKLFYVKDHTVSVDTIIAWQEDVNVMVKSVPWGFVGKDYEGNTEALIFEIDKNKIVDSQASKIIAEKRPVQNSVRMIYVKLNLAMNSDAKEDVDYKKYFDARINDIANKQDVMELGYFWGVEEAKIVTECSMVIRGSNDATPIRQKNEEAVINDTSEKIEPINFTQKKETKFLNPNLY
jgi:hypothetical protein